MLYSVHFVDANIGHAVGRGGTLYRTSNGGLSFPWSTPNSGTSEYLLSVYFPAVDVGFAVGDNGLILKYGIPTALSPRRYARPGFNPIPALGRFDVRGKTLPEESTP
jgi:photosystem II stability/assembly factor-like uncharacterized protein